jgi:hypothetical protein
MKQINSNNVLPAYLIKPVMNKFLWIVGLVVFSQLAFSQCENNTVKANFFPLIEQSKINPETGTAVLGVVAFKSSGGTVFPYYFEWRANSPEGEVLLSGNVEKPFDKNKFFIKTGRIKAKEGVYYLKVCDASNKFNVYKYQVTQE